MNKVVALTAGAALMLAVSSAQAIEGSVDVGKDYTNLNVGMGTSTPGLFLNGNWMRSNDDGSLAGLGLGYNFGFDQLMLSPGVKAMYVNPRHGSDGYTAAIGAGAQFSLTKMFGLYGSYYWAPDAFSHNIDSYEEIQGGVSFTPISMLNIHAGYQYVTLDGKGHNKDSVLADGPYIGASLRF